MEVSKKSTIARCKGRFIQENGCFAGMDELKNGEN
jgi:hypothetical protein